MQNLNSTCYQFTLFVIEELKKKGVEAYSMCKTAGEGQYVPPGFAPRPVTGLDGKTYTVTGVSHDAIWVEDGATLVQVDTIGRGNDSPHPIFDSNGVRITGIPTWNEIPSQFWRPNNPPLKTTDPIPTPTPTPDIPGYEEIGGDTFFRAEIGIPLQADMALVGQTLNDGSSVWFSRTCYDVIVAHMENRKEDVPEIVRKHRNEWRAILGLPPI